MIYKLIIDERSNNQGFNFREMYGDQVYNGLPNQERLLLLLVKLIFSYCLIQYIMTNPY